MLKMMFRVMMLPLVVVGCQSSLSASVREATTASGADNAASPRLADTAGTGLFHLREADHYAKQLEGTQKYTRAVQIELPISRATHAIIVSNTHALPAEYKCLK